MMSHNWHASRRHEPAFAGSLLPVVFILFCSFGAIGFPSRACTADEVQAGDDATKNAGLAREQRKKRLAEMRRRAEATKVYVLGDGERKPVNMLPGPLMRWHDVVHRPRIVDATLWAWGTNGRPLATQNIVLTEAGSWYDLESLSDGLIAVEWADGRPWSSKKPGIEWQTLPDAPEPADGKTRRTFQLKEIARRFSAIEEEQEELRFLPRPVRRFSDPESGLMDGAMFVFTSRGLCADLLLVLELRAQAPSGPVWKYGQVRMCTQPLSLRLDGQEVWTAPGLHGWQRWDSWVSFHSSDPTRF